MNPEDPELLEIQRLNAFIADTYQDIFDSSWIEHKSINKHSWLFRVVGSDANVGNPYLLTAHLDVVPAGKF